MNRRVVCSAARHDVTGGLTHRPSAAFDNHRDDNRVEIASYDFVMALEDYIASEIVLDCTDGVFSRREALRRLMLLGLTAPAAAAMLAACGDDDPTTVATAAPVTDSAESSTSSLSVATTSPTTSIAPVASGPVTSDTASEEIRFAGPTSDLIGVLANAAEPKGAVLIIHENRGLTDHFRVLPTRLATDGYTSLAIDLLSEEGGTATMASDGDATAALGNAPAERMIADLRAGLDELERRAPGTKKAVIGFCFGGGMTWQLLAAGEPRLSAAVPFYGPAPAEPDFSGSPNAAVLGVYAELDSRVNASQETAEGGLVAAGLVHEIKVYPGVDHAFFNDTGARYDEEQAAQAYQDMLTWFERHLS